MYEVENQRSFTLYRYSFDDNLWHPCEECENEKELVELISRFYKNAYYRHIIPGTESEYEKKVLENSLFERTVMHPNEADYMHDLILLDSDERIVNPRLYEEEAKKRYEHISSIKKPGLRHGWRYKKPESQRDVPLKKKDEYVNTGIRHEKNWFHNRRQDENPEHKEFVRNNGKVPDVWDTEPWVERGKSWKNKTKCRKQYQVHKPAHFERDRHLEDAMKKEVRPEADTEEPLD